MPRLDEKISKAKSKLLLEHPLFGTIASRLEMVQNDDIEAFKSNGITLEYNGDFLASIESAELEFVLANGAMHAALKYQNRKQNRSGWLWQLSCDYAINDMLVKNGMSRPYQAPYSKRFDGLYAEEIYAELKADILRDELEYEADNEADVEERKEQEQKERESSQAAQREEELLKEELFSEFAEAILEGEAARNELPEGIERFFEIGRLSQIDWREELKAAIDSHFKNDFTLLPPSKKLLYEGIYLPSNISQTFSLVIAIDSSGSIDDALLGEFLSEVNFLMSFIAHYRIELVVCDEKIRSHATFYSGDALACEIKGGGATDFRPVFEFVGREFDDVRLLLYFTDLDGVFPDEAPNYEVKWVSASHAKEPPFGSVIEL
ncbi:MAG: hypothetical protein IE916_02455 [Epsilonproteobacteria bacterium]|nr:hypothetical protein [Campylobacterota bacterium]